MSCDWITTTLGAVTKWSSGGTPSKSKEEYWGGDIPWISASSMSGTRYSDSELKVTQLGLENGTRLAHKGSILLLVRGGALHNGIPVGIASQDVAFNQDVKAIQAIPESVTPWYLLFWFLSKRDELLQMVELTGIGAGKLDTKRLQGMEFHCPPMEEMLRLESACKAIDDKLVLNTQTNQTLEQMAQALFKSWFVDFDPVIDNALAAGNPIPEPLAERAAARQALFAEPVTNHLDSTTTPQHPPQRLPEQTRQLFPDSFEEHPELGWIPAGWVLSELKSLGSIVTGKTPSKKIEDAFADIGAAFLTPSDIDNAVFSTDIGRRLSENGSAAIKKGLLSAGSICVTCIGSQMGKTTILPVEGYTNQQINSVVPNNRVFRNFIFLELRRRRNEIFALGSSGSTMPILNKTGFGRLPILVPSEPLIAHFDQLVEPLFKGILEHSRQSKSVSQLRDTLLPKLLSGELSLSEIDEDSELES